MNRFNAKIDEFLFFAVATYLRFFAGFVLRRWHPRVIAITGSAGKTTLLNLLELQFGKQAHYSHQANSAAGVALDVLGLTGVTGSRLRWVYLLLIAPWRALTFMRREPFYIVEIDAGRPGGASFLADWLRPETTCWISVGLSHALFFEPQVQNGQFPTLEAAITSEFASVPRATTDFVYIDGASTAMVTATAGLAAQVIAIDPDLSYSYTVSPSSTTFQIGDHYFTFNHPEPRALVTQLAMLLQIAQKYQLTPISDCSALRLAAGRSSYFRGLRGLHLLDSSYNAQPLSVRSILTMVQEMTIRPRWLVIGDLVEQGSQEQQVHVELAQTLAQTEPDQVILVGPRTQSITAPLLEQQGIAVKSFLRTQDAYKYIKATVQGGELLVFKGSQYLEWIIEQLLADPADRKKLPRREPAAVRRRAKKRLF